jgi:putative redox protein
MALHSTTTATIAENGQSVFAVSIDVSGHRLIGDEPESADGKNLGPAPYDLLTAALGECTAMTIRWYARQKNWPLERVEVVMTHHKADGQGGSGKTDVFTKHITLHGDSLTAEQRAKLVEIAAKCPVQRTLEGTPVINTAA